MDLVLNSMFLPDQYQLLDFGDGEKVERFANSTVRRETPSVPTGGRLRSLDSTQLRFRRDAASRAGQWSGEPPAPWQIQHGRKTFLLRPTPAGQVGVFPEQAANWRWIDAHATALTGKTALNLFGYTGGTTMALAAAGASVTHVDAAKTVVRWARDNAAASGLSESPIRWITEDAVRFVEREIQRGRTYDIVVADPPSFGRGPAKETWKFERDLPQLLDGLAQLTGSRPTAVLLSGHTVGYDGGRLAEAISAVWPLPNQQVEAAQMTLTSVDERVLGAGHVARWVQP